MKNQIFHFYVKLYMYQQDDNLQQTINNFLKKHKHIRQQKRRPPPNERFITSILMNEIDRYWKNNQVEAVLKILKCFRDERRLFSYDYLHLLKFENMGKQVTNYNGISHNNCFFTQCTISSQEIWKRILASEKLRWDQGLCQ